MRRTSILLIPALLAATVPGSLDEPAIRALVMVSETTVHSGSQRPMQSRIAIAGQDVLMDMSSLDGQPQHSMIFRGGPGEMTIVDHTQRSYVLLDQETLAGLKAQLGAAAGQMSEARRMMEEQLKNMSAAEREALERSGMLDRMMAMAGGDPVVAGPEYAGTEGSNETALGSCTWHHWKKEGVTVLSLCEADGPIEGWQEGRVAFEAMTAFVKDLTGPLANLVANPFDQSAEIDNVPLASRSFSEDGTLESETQVLSIGHEDVADDAWDVPEGYERQDITGRG
jgi:hypothetical protein